MYERRFSVPRAVGIVTGGELWTVLKAALLFALVAGVNKALDGASVLDWGEYKFLYDAAAAALLWLLAKWATPVGPQPFVRKKHG